MGEESRNFNEVLSSRVKRRWFLYVMMGAFYCLDIYVTLLILGSGFNQESNPISRSFITASGLESWVAFRIILLFMTTIALLTVFVLATMMLRHLGREKHIDRVEEVALGSVMLFYALTLVHNLLSIMAPLPY